MARATKAEQRASVPRRQVELSPEDLARYEREQARLSNDAELFPGQLKSWSLPFMRNEERAPTGRPAGAQGWAGLANLFNWIDRKNGIGGNWATQILPFGDPASFVGYMELETATRKSML